MKDVSKKTTQSAQWKVDERKRVERGKCSQSPFSHQSAKSYQGIQK